jgi:hypothetical protein
VKHVWVTDTEESGKTSMKKKKITIQCAVCESAGEVEDEDFSYDYSGINHDKLQ